MMRSEIIKVNADELRAILKEHDDRVKKYKDIKSQDRPDKLRINIDYDAYTYEIGLDYSPEKRSLNTYVDLIFEEPKDLPF